MTNQEIINAGQTIYDETVEAANTSERVGSVIKGIGENLNNKDEAINAQAAQTGYYECTVSGTTLAVTAPGYKIPTNGGCMRIKMSAPGTGACTLNIGSTGAKQLLYNGLAVSSENTWEAGEIISVFYDPKANSNNGAYQASNARGGMKLDDVPTQGSSKGVKSGGVYATTPSIKDTQVEGDLSIIDEGGNVLAVFGEGHVKTKNFNSANLPALGTKNNADYDFTIEDEIGQAIVIFGNGHIRTKNFNSANLDVANYLKDKFSGKKIAIVGDSISTYQGWLPSDVPGFSGTSYATYYPNGDVNAVSKTWWYLVAQNLGIKTTDIANTSWSGGTVCGDSTSTTNGKPACSTKRINDISIRGFDPDIIIVYIGCNDWYQCGLSGYSTTLGTWAITDAVPAEGNKTAFRDAYALMLSKLQNKYPNARIFCCTILDDWRRDGVSDDASDNAWPSNNSAGYTTKQWNDNIKEIAEAFACDVIDMHNCGINYYNIPSFAVDAGLHPNAAGHALMARKVTSELMAKY